MKKLLAIAALAVVSLNVSASAEDLKYQEWANTHKDWVRLHPDRARFFATHPDLAEKYRHEWADWHEKATYSEWAEHHPGWVSTHHERAEFFRAHPEEAEKARKEWWEHHETRKEYQEWEHAHH